MASAAAPPSRSGGFFRSPWLLLGAGLASAVLGYLVSFADFVPSPLRLLFLGAAALLAALAVQARLRPFETAEQGSDLTSMPWRIESSALISLVGLICLLGYGSLDKAWLSGHMVYGFLFLLCLLGSLLLLLPPLGRRLVLSAVVIFHFTGIAVAVTTVDPPNSVGPYLSRQLYYRVYRPYLSFLYMTNAYHFYSPDPGPASLLWCAVHFDNGTYRWVKFPERSNSPIGMHYQRMLALPEHTFAAQGRLPPSREDYGPGQEPPLRGTWEDIYRRREIGSGDFVNPETGKAYPIPMLLDVDVTAQYREPTETSQMVIQSVARRVAATTPPPEGAKVRSVKMYRITHQILSPYELSKGVSPLDKSKHLAFFIGEFDPEGRIKDPLDPYLYWYLPIIMVPGSYPHHGGASRPGVPAIKTREAVGADAFLLDCLELHAAGRLAKKGEQK